MADHRWIADGNYAAEDGTTWRWYVEALPDLPAPVLFQTVQGWCGAELVTDRAEVAAACQATACAAIDRLVAERTAKRVTPRRSPSRPA